MTIDGYGLKGLTKPLEAASVACCCSGPQGNQPVCPCQMRSVQIIDGRYVRVVDLGPAPTKPPKADSRFFGTD